MTGPALALHGPAEYGFALGALARSGVRPSGSASSGCVPVRGRAGEDGRAVTIPSVGGSGGG